jgi:hypothetical protein
MKMSENTNTARHTPGPWHKQVLSEGTDNEFVTVCSPEEFELICEINPKSNYDRIHANADLIAAAPDLLAALNRAEAFIVSELDVRQTSYGSDGDDGGYIGEARSALEIVRAAIAKARGK